MMIRSMISPKIKEAFENDKIRKENNAKTVLGIRSTISKALESIKTKSVNVFDEGIGFVDKQMTSPDAFQMSFEVQNKGSTVKRFVHLTGMVSTPSRETSSLLDSLPTRGNA